MTQQHLNFGTAGSDDGEFLATAFAKIEANFTDLYTTLGAPLAGVAVGSVLASAGVGVAPVWSSSPVLTGSLGLGSSPLAVGTLLSLYAQPPSATLGGNLTGLPPGQVVYEHTVGPAGSNWARVNDSIAQQNGLIYRRANGTVAAPLPLNQDDVIMNFTGRGWQGTNGYTQGGQGSADIEFRAAENWANGVAGGYMQFRTTDPGTISSNYRMRIARGVCIASSSDASAFFDPGVNYLAVAAIVGGNASFSGLSLQSTAGIGASDFVRCIVGNNGATEAWRTVTGGQMVFGYTASVAGTSALAVAVQVHGTAAATAAMSNTRWSADTNAPQYQLLKSRGATISTRGAVASGDVMGTLIIGGDDGTNFQRGAQIQGVCDGTVSGGIVPGRLVLLTAATNGASVEAVRIDKAQAVYFPVIGTTANAANAFLDSGSSPVNNLLRSTSSLRYKRNVEDLADDFADHILALRPVWYRSKAPNDNQAWSWYGLIAEEVAKVDPRLVHWSFAPECYDDVETHDDEGGRILTKRLKPDSPLSPESVQYERLTVLLLSVVKRQQQRISQLEQRAAA